MGTAFQSPLGIALTVGAIASLSGCGGGGGGGLNIQPSSIVVEGRAKGKDGANRPIADSVLSLRHDADNQEPRLVYDNFANVSQLERITLAGTRFTGLPFQEEWHYLVTTHTWTRPGSDIVPVIASGDRSWVRNHKGNLAWLVVRHENLALPSDSFSAFSGLNEAGSAVLARRENDDPVLPWVRNDNCDLFSALPIEASLRPPAANGASDCFDMQSFTSAMLNQIAVTVEDKIADFNNSSDPIQSLVNARVTEHRIYFVPHVPEGPFPGFGFIYETSLEADFVGITAARLTISIPITFHWMRAAIGGKFTVNIDPLGPAFPGAPLVNDTRIAVSTLRGDLAEGTLEQIRTKIVAGIQSAPMPTGPLNISFDSLLSTAFALYFLPGNDRLSANFSILALPEDQTIAGTPSNLVMRMGALAVSDITPTPAQAGGNNARTITIDGAGRVVVLQNLNNAGTRARLFRLPAPQELLPIKLYLLN